MARDMDAEKASQSAVRVLCNAVQMVHHFETTQEGFSPPCETVGEYMLQDALMYLAYGDLDQARGHMEIYEEWEKTGKVPWPYDGGPPPGYEIEEEKLK